MKNCFRFHRIFLLLVLGLPVMMVAAGNSTAADDEPTIAKDSIRVKIANNAGGTQTTQTAAWLPFIEFRVNGPIASGSQLSVEFSLPTKPHWIEFDCQTAEIKKGEWWSTSCGGGPKAKAVFYSGPVGFTIRIRNEMLGTNATLFTGKAKVVKEPQFAGSKDFNYYADEDWNIPIGYVFFGSDGGYGASLHVGFWYRGNPPEIAAHLFYKGKDIAKYTSAGNGADRWNPAERQWGFVDCEFLGVYPTTPAAGAQGYDPRFGVRDNPGDYEVKVLIVNRLARSIKFTVGADGSFDNGIATANKLGSDRVIVPVQVIGNQGPWDRLAWKTGAFYDNPLTGFTPIP